jgi:hypothetical protein
VFGLAELDKGWIREWIAEGRVRVLVRSELISAGRLKGSPVKRVALSACSLSRNSMTARLANASLRSITGDEVVATDLAMKVAVARTAITKATATATATTSRGRFCI